MMMSINIESLLSLFELAFNQFRMDGEDDTDLFFQSRGDFLDFAENLNEQIENMSEFCNLMGGNFIADKSESVAQMTLFLADEEGIACISKLFSINY